MIYQDRIYGKVKISEPIVLELIKNSSIQRLKEINQAGYPKPFFSIPLHSRFEHSIGVYLLLKKYNAPLEEQIAGLIHDVSHSVFSHCIDYALNEGSEKTQNHQDNIFEEFVKQTDIPEILNKQGMDINYILNDSNFPLKEKKLPDLCADRIDYSLRTAIMFDMISKKELEHIFNSLTTESNNWVFNDFQTAKNYAELFLRLNNFCYAGLSSALMFRTVGDCLKYALQKNYVTKSDLYSTDKKVLGKIRQYLVTDKHLKFLFDKMNGKIGFKLDSHNYNAHVFCKSRVVDPLFKQNGKIKKVSEVDENWIKVLERESIPKEYFIKFEN